MKPTWTAVAGLAAVLALAAGCDKHDEHEHTGGHDHEDKGHASHGGDVAVPDRYKDAVAKCEDLSNRIGGLVQAGTLRDVPGAAGDIKKIAEKLPELAQKDLKPEMVKEVNVTSKELASLFDEMDEAEHKGDKAAMQKAHDRMKALIVELKKHTGTGHEHH